MEINADEEFELMASNPMLKKRNDFKSSDPIQPQHSIEAESSVLGGLLLDNKSLDLIDGGLTANDFYRFEHQVAYSAIIDLINAGKPADVVTVFEYLRARGKDVDVGGLQYLNSLAQYVPSAANIRRYAEIVRERAQMRSLANAGHSILRIANDASGRSASELIGEAQEMVFNLLSDSSTQNTDSLIESTLMEIVDWINDDSTKPDQSTGFIDLDQMIGGLGSGQLCVLAARPSMGKTALAMNICQHIAVKERKPVIFFSLEMTRTELGMRFISSVGEIPLHQIKNKRMSADDDWLRLVDAVETIGSAPLRIDDAAGISVGEIRSRARRFARDFKDQVALVVVDHLHIISESGSNNNDNKASRMADISKGLKALAKELGCPVLTLAQLNRKVEDRTDKRPVMSDLRESGAIEQDADLIMLLYRDEYYSKDACKEPGVAEIIIGKQRNGPTGTVKLGFAGELTKFYNLSE
nr:replicative DNA helicase [uncultured bacterium]